MEETGGRRITMVDKTTQLLLKTFGVLLKATRRTKAQKQDDKAKALRGRMASPRIQERISMVDLARLAGEVYTDLRDPSTTPQGFGRALREGKQDLESAQDVSIDRRVANLADKREGEATKRDRKKSARLQVVRRRNDEPPTPVHAFLKAFGVMKARSAANRAKNKRARGLRRTKAESRKLDALFARAQAAERSLTPKEHAEMTVHPDVNQKPFLKPAITAGNIVDRNEATERQREWGRRNKQRVATKPRIKNPYEHIDASGKRDDLAHAAEVYNPSVAANPGSWTPAQQRLMTDAEKGQQRAIARIGDKKVRERRKPTLGEIKRRHTKQGE